MVRDFLLLALALVVLTVSGVLPAAGAGTSTKVTTPGLNSTTPSDSGNIRRVRADVYPNGESREERMALPVLDLERAEEVAISVHQTESSIGPTWWETQTLVSQAKEQVALMSAQLKHLYDLLRPRVHNLDVQEALDLVEDGATYPVLFNRGVHPNHYRDALIYKTGYLNLYRHIIAQLEAMRYGKYYIQRERAIHGETA